MAENLGFIELILVFGVVLLLAVIELVRTNRAKRTSRDQQD